MRRFCPHCGERLKRTATRGGIPRQECPNCDDDELRTDGGSVDTTDETPLWRRDEGRFVNYRTKYLERTTDLPEKKARVLALSELGYSTTGIAERVDHTTTTVDGYLAEIAVRFGPRAAHAKTPGTLVVDAPLNPVTEDAILTLPKDTRKKWLELAEKHATHAPEWVNGLRYYDASKEEGGAP